MKNLYDADYFEKGLETNVSCYSNYRWIPELTIPLAARIIEYLGIKENETILDFGCAKGYLVKAFRLLHREAYGYDISDYALDNVPREIQNYVSSNLSGEFNWVISKDVFEHIPYDEIVPTLKEIRKLTSKMFCIVPLGNGQKYNIPLYERDVTHIIREDLSWWENTFRSAGYKVLEAQYRINYIKENWAKWDRGNGFFVLSSEN